MTYVMSDIHGNQARFEDVMRKINLQPEDTLYILGDVIDRFPDGIKMIRQFMKMPNVKMLLGNHEHMMLEALYYPIVVKKPWDNEDYVRQDKLKLWYYNGGDITHYYLKHIRKAIRQEVFEFLSNLPLNIHVEVNGQKYLLIHGGVEANFEQNNYKHDDKVTYAVWSRQSRHEVIPDDTILIFGHTPTNHFQNDEPLILWKNENYIGIDCGCGYDYPGRLCCLRLDDMQEFYSNL